MAWQLVVRRCARRGDTLVFKALRSPLQRLRGLLGTGPDASPVALVGCRQVHTVGMRYRIDVAFVGANGVVLDVRNSVSPGRLLGDERAWVTLERPHQRTAWLVAGETVEMELVEAGTWVASSEEGK